MRFPKLMVACILLSGIVIAGCTGPEPKDGQFLQLDGENAADANTASGSDAQVSDINVNLTGDTELSQLETSKNTQQTGDPTMMAQTEKTLADFTPIDATSVTLHTSKGDITFDIYTDKVPLTAQNFLNLAQDGFYDGILFHRVIENFMAQAGDPLTKDPSKEALWGTGGPGYVIADEFLPELKHDSAGIVSMANKGTPKSGGSQFFITHEATPWLDGKHTVFGKVTEGLDVLMNITQGDIINSVSFK